MVGYQILDLGIGVRLSMGSQKGEDMITKDISVVMTEDSTGLEEGPGYLYFTKGGTITIQNGESPILRAVTEQQFKAWEGLIKSDALSAEKIEIYKKENGHWAHRKA